jgi:Tfp pilus assembly protein PilN
MEVMDSDFVTQRRSMGVAGMVVALLGLCAAAWVILAYVDDVRQRDSWEAKLLEIKKMSRRTPGVIGELQRDTRDSRELQQEVRLANTVLRQIAVPWDTLFREIEANTHESVALLSVQPDVQNRVVRIAGEAKNLDVLLDYIRRLGASKTLTNIFLTGHEIKGQDAQRPVSFSLVAAWADKR